jgi:protein O-mannosyl-transferase
VASKKRSKSFKKQTEKVQKISSENKTVKSAARSKHFFLYYTIPVAVTLIAFLPALKNGFVNWDDTTYIVENEYLRHFSFEKVKYYFSNFYYGNYHPFTMISYLAEYHFFKLEPYRYHLHNLIRKISEKKEVAFFVALLFGIHPMHVESVAWISERKDVLYTFFFLLSAIVYTNYISNTKNQFRNYFLCLLFFIFSLLSKPAAVTFPFVIVLIDYWLGRKFEWKLIAEKIPFFLLSATFGVIAVFAQESSDAIAKFETFTIFQRIMFACYGLLKYMQMLFVPFNQSCFHPYPFLVDGDKLPFIFYLSPILVLIVFGLITLSYKKSKLFVFGFFFFFLNIMLVLQWMSVGNAIMAERYTYVPYIGLFFIIAEGTMHLYEKEKYRSLSKVFFVIIISASAFFAFLTHERNKVWKDTETLWTDFINKFPAVHDGYYNRAGDYARREKYEEAMNDYSMTIKLRPDISKAYVYRGNIYGIKGQTELALADYKKSIELDSTFLDAYVNRAITYSMMKNYENAFYDYEKALQIEPGNVKVFLNRSFALIETKQYEKAIADCNEVLKINPNNEMAWHYKGVANHNSGNYSQAIEDYSRSIALSSNNGHVFQNRSMAYKAAGKFTEALSDIIKAQSMGVKTDPAYIAELESKAK